ncbi:MAG: lysophospholipid acyltransferase family protein [Prevotella sp.]|nr:lysophospholipid acyltransferase family protein [Prevotella sp.]
MYYILYGFCYLLSLLPFRALYVLSDGIYLVLYRLVGYRKRVVRKNLSASFPEKSDEERRDIEKKFYHWLCDFFLEAIKLLSISKKNLDKRFIMTNPEVVTDCFKEGQSVAAILGHYCNWEWLSCVGKDYDNEKWKVGLVYHPLYNKAADRLWHKIRSCIHNGVPVPKQDILRYLIDFKREGIMSIFGYVSDQTPKWENIHLWLPFLNQDTPVFTGAERIMKKMNNAVVYVEMSRPRRGYYTCTYHLITKEPQKMEEHEITRRFIVMLEQTIRQHPEFYLWSHNRWKRTHEEFDRRFKVVNGKVLKREEGDT